MPATSTRIEILFKSERFNLSEPRDFYINDCCFGDDVARWLVGVLRSRNVDVTEPDQEDWGWYIDVALAGQRYFVGIGGVADDEQSLGNRGQWRLMIEKYRTIWERIRRCNELSPEDPLVRLLLDIVADADGLNLIGLD